MVWAARTKEREIERPGRGVTMPEEFSKIDIDEPEDLDHVVSSIESHARKLVKAQLEREGQQVKADEETRLLCEKVIEQVCTMSGRGSGRSIH